MNHANFAVTGLMNIMHNTEMCQIRSSATCKLQWKYLYKCKYNTMIPLMSVSSSCGQNYDLLADFVLMMSTYSGD